MANHQGVHRHLRRQNGLHQDHQAFQGQDLFTPIDSAVHFLRAALVHDDNDYRNKVANWYEELIQKSEISDKIKLVPISWSTEKSSRHLFQIITCNIYDGFTLNFLVQK